MKYYLLILTLIIVSCGHREIKHSGLNDLFVGVQQIILYEDRGFYLELSFGGTEGVYKISNDTLLLTYDKKTEDSWPDKFLIKKDFFESISVDSLDRNKIRIKRSK